MTTQIGYAWVCEVDGSQAHNLQRDAVALIDTTTANSARILAGLIEFERKFARARHGGRPFMVMLAKMRLAQAAVGKPGTNVAELCADLGVTRQTLYRHVTPNGGIKPDDEKLLARRVQ